MLAELGSPVTPQVNVDLQDLFNGPAGDQAAEQLGLDPTSLRATTPLVAALSGTRARHHLEFLGLTRPLRTRGSRWCPQCLNENHFWQDSWRDPLHLYCTQHRLTLESRCYWCSSVPFESSSWLTSLGRTDECPDFITDHYLDGTRYRGRCGHRFAHPDPTPARDSDLELQQILFDYAHKAHHTPGVLVRACGIDAQALPVYEAALEIISTISPNVSTAHPFDNDERLRHAVRVAMKVLLTPTPEAALRLARQHHAFGIDDHKMPVLGPRRAAREAPRNPLLVAIWLSDAHERVSLPYELRFRLGSPRPCYPDGWQDHDRALQEKDRRPGLPISVLPQAAWGNLQLIPDAEGLGLDSCTGRTFVSLCLARYATTRPFGVLATALGLPGWSASLYTRHWRTIHQAGRWREYLQGLDQLFNLLHETPPPINYQKRRTDAWEPQHLLPVAEHLLPQVRDVGGKRPSLPALTRSLWALYTGGDAALAPSDYGSGKGRRSTSVVDLDHRIIAERWPYDLVPLEGPLAWNPPP